MRKVKLDNDDLIQYLNIIKALKNIQRCLNTERNIAD